MPDHHVLRDGANAPTPRLTDMQYTPPICLVQHITVTVDLFSMSRGGSFLLIQRSAKLSVKGQTVNVLGFADERDRPCCNCSTLRAAQSGRGSRQTSEHGCFHSSSFVDTGF